MNAEKMGRQIAMFRKERGLTQEVLADILNISAQAISKWENGHSLPETSLLPSIAGALDCTIDSLFSMSDLIILDAWFGDGIEKRSVTTRLTKYIENNTLRMAVNPNIFDSNEGSGRVLYLIVKYRNLNGVYYTYAKQNEVLDIDAYSEGYSICGEKIEIIAASYGNSLMHSDVMKQMKHYSVFNWSEYPANDEVFPSNPMNDKREYLTLVYTNNEGINMVTCEEGESIAYSEDRTGLYRKNAEGNIENFIYGVEYLTPFRKGRECSLIESLTAAARAIGIKTTYERLMGASGACFMFAFSSPQWDYTSADGIMAYDYSEAAYKALGYKCVSTGRIDKHSRESERQKIIDSLRRGMPILAINLRVDNAWGIICGYREDKNGNVELFCRTKYDLELDNNEYQEKKDCDNSDCYARVDNWPSNIIYFTQQMNRPSERENFMHSLLQFTDCFTSQKNKNYYLGCRAFEKLREDLLDDDWYEKASDGQFARRFSVAQFSAMCLKDARRCAYIYLKESRKLLEGVQVLLLDEIISIYKEVYRVAEKMFNMIDTAEVLEGKAARSIWTVDKRHRQAEMVKELIELETKALTAVRKLLNEKIKEVL